MSQVDEIKELDALVSLMDEPNEEMFVEIRQKVLSYGKLALPLLEEAWVNTMGEDDSDRIEGVIDEIQQNGLVDEFKSWIRESDGNIIEGLMIITKYYHPEFDKDYYLERFDKLFRETWLELNDNLTALEKIKVINHVIYHVYSFTSDLSGVVGSDTYFINKVLDTKKGNSLSIGIIYIAIAQKLGIPIFGVGLPSHFILGYMNDFIDLQLPHFYNEDDVLFYLNPSNSGAIFTHKEISHYLIQANIESDSRYFLPCSNKAVMKRLIDELIVSFEKDNRHSKTLALIRLQTILDTSR